MGYPYQHPFEKYLVKKMLADSTIKSYDHDLNDFFTYLRHFNTIYQEKPSISQLQESDIRDYFAVLLVKRSNKYTTYNKVLSHLKRYFEYLFHENLIQTLPTLALTGKKLSQTNSSLLDWPKELSQLLASKELSFYTRLTLLLCAHFYPVSEFLQPNFYTVFKHEHLEEFEKEFMQDFFVFIQPLRQKQKTADLFLKHRFDPITPQLTLPALHKYLKYDEKKCTFSLSPQKLYQNAIFHYLALHQHKSDSEILQKLRLTPSSLNYYRQTYWKKKSL
ncbi:integrase recombinase xerD [Liquorilactobacillus aquaticus DSM 21051]|uniref:Integrase recombinase xerD n=1 Tax=Liquorilactobacillus aquaticus DSM 21051 TaxID=1423725 RepID=A0A0R2CXJ2_9LACO|nr:site-specific integrase [Liquorilactobacillus aquaticus]KRM96336.1 integrase recombinase xerD [Liquorilactobacillus aquaticus DSM 21051]